MQKRISETKIEILYAVQISISSRKIYVQLILCPEYETVLQNLQDSECPTIIIFTCFIPRVSAKAI